MANRVGQQFGQYRLSRFLGQGSFAKVYLGEHIYNNTLVAVKVLEAQLTAPDLKEFINEASTTLRLQHPHIVRLLDFGIGPVNTPFLVMAYAANGTLRELHPKGTRLPLSSIIAYICPIASALQHAHDERLIHRDVKPENILLGPNNEVWLSDFGITSVAHSTRSLDTEKPGGTVPYMAPEQLRGKARPASDQYALGIMVYEWLCGERPFTGTATEIAMQHVLEPPPSLREKMPTILPDVEQVVMTVLSKDPGERFTSVQAFATALQAAADVQPRLHLVSARTSGGVPTSSMVAPVDEASPTVHTNEQHVPALPPTGPSAETVTSMPSPVTSEASEERAATQVPLSVAQGKKPLPEVSIPSSFLPTRMCLPKGPVVILILFVLVVGSGGIWATLSLTTHHPPATPTATTQVAPTPSPYDQFAMKNGIQFGFDAQHSGFNPYESELSPVTVATLVQGWTGTTDSKIYSSPAVVNGVVYVSSLDKLYAFKATGCDQPTCSPLWTGTTDSKIYSSPAVVNGVVYVSSPGKLYAFKADGCGQPTCSPLWTSTTTDNSVGSSPAVANGVVYVGSNGGKLYAFKADGCDQPTCSPLWTGTANGVILSPPAVANGVVYVGSWDHKLYAFKAAGCDQPTCQPLWTATTGSGIYSSPAVANGVVYVGSSDSELYAFKATGCDQPTCQPLWTATTDSTVGSSPAVANGVVYVSSTNSELYAFKAAGCDQPTCQPLWTATTGNGISSPAVANGVVYVGSNGGKLYAFKADGCGQPTCSPLWTASTDNQIHSSPAVANGAVYVGSDDGKLYAFQRR